MWNGTAATLKPKPTISRPSARNRIGVGDIACAAIRLPMRSRRVLPVSP
jgi:hypothetical protein